ncbi:hypothetical protein PspLS_09842, partial [Pyricularia sp. CBS 133598]
HSAAAESPFITQYSISTCSKPIRVESVLPSDYRCRVLNRHLFEQYGPQSSKLQVQGCEPASPLWCNHSAVSEPIHADFSRKPRLGRIGSLMSALNMMSLGEIVDALQEQRLAASAPSGKVVRMALIVFLGNLIVAVVLRIASILPRTISRAGNCASGLLLFSGGE